jgi:subtilisin family serine protease
MSRGALGVLGAALTALIAPVGALAAGPAKPVDPAAVPGARVSFELTRPSTPHLLVTFADTPSAATARARLAGLGRIAAVVPEAGIWSAKPRDVSRARDRALARDGVTGVEWSRARASEQAPPPPAPLGTPGIVTDPLFTPTAQWGLLTRTSWGADLTTIAERPRIAILDSGIDPTHEEWGGPASPLVAPRSTLRNDGNAVDHGLTGHGTHVAGIAAAPVNGVGIVGVAPAGASAQVIPVQIADQNGDSSDLTIIRGIRWAVRHGAKVINISAGGVGYSRAFQDTILWASSRGALVVASVGNQGQDVNVLNYPAAYRRVLGVGAQCDGIATYDCPRPFGVATFSTHNRSVDVIAPGVNVLSTVPLRVSERVVRPGYALKDGTSMAAPFVAGVAALVMASNRGALSGYQVMSQIQNTATDIGSRGRDDFSGHGVVNPRAAVTLNAPADDTDEVNDDVKWVSRAISLNQRRPATIKASADRVEDPDDVYAVRLRKGERLRMDLFHRRGTLDLYLWNPGTRTVSTGENNLARHLVRFRSGVKRRTVMTVTAPKAGRYYVNVFARAGKSTYTLRLTRKR